MKIDKKLIYEARAQIGSKRLTYIKREGRVPSLEIWEGGLVHVFLGADVEALQEFIREARKP